VIVHSELVVAGGDASEVLEAAESGFDAPTVAVSSLVVFDLALSMRAARNDWLGSNLSERATKVI